MRKSIMILIGLLFICIPSLFAVVINVPADQPTIQEGLDAASVNDTVLVADGTYLENIEWPNTDGIVLISETGATNTIIDGNEQGRVIHVSQHHTLSNVSVVDGFTIQNGYYSGVTPHPGGGIADYGGLTWTNNIIKDNYGSGLGGGMIMAGGFPLIFNNIFMDNISGDAGGALCVSWCAAVIRNNTIVGNSIEDGSGGGGIVIFFASVGTTFIEDNIIVNNSAQGTDLGGGGISVYYSDCSLDYNNVWGNSPNDYVECSAGPNSISYDPWFISNEEGDYFLDQDISPCIDAGSQTAIEAGLNNYTTSYGAVLDTDQVDIGYHYNPDYFDPVDTNENTVLPADNLLLSNYPNPFNPTTTISFSVTQNSDFVNLEIFNIKGQKIKTLIDKRLESSSHQVIWNGTDDTGKPVSSGIYFYKLQTGTNMITKKMLLLE